MKVTSLHSPLVRRAIETINEGQLEDFLALFARNATVIDEARIKGQRQFGRGRSEKRSGCTCISTYYEKRMRKELFSK